MSSRALWGFAGRPASGAGQVLPLAGRGRRPPACLPQPGRPRPGTRAAALADGVGQASRLPAACLLVVLLVVSAAAQAPVSPSAAPSPQLRDSLSVSVRPVPADEAQPQRPTGASRTGRLSRLQAAARAAVAAGQASPAVQALTAALQRDPNWPEGLWDLGSILYEGGQTNSARQAFGRLTVLVPKRGAGWAMLGLCDFAAHDYGMSLRHLQHGRSLGLARAGLADTARLHEAEDFLVLGQYTQATHLLDPFALHPPSPPETVATFGLAALRLPVLPSAMDRVLSPARVKLVLAAGRALAAAAAHHNTAAEITLRALIRSHPRAAYLRYNLGVLLAAQGHNSAAEAEFQRELQLSPHSAATHLQLVAAELQTGDYAGAERNARQAVRLRPNSFAAHYLLGLTLFRENHLHAAARQLETSKRLQPDVSDVRYTLAQVDLRLHRTQAALREEKAFRRLAPLSSAFRLQGNLPASVYEHPKFGTP